MNRPHVTILLVEDNPGDARLFREMLRDMRHVEARARFAASLEVAAANLCSEAFDVVLLDLSLPDSEGLDTLAKIRRAAPDVPIVILTGSADEDLAVRAVQTGAQDYLVKDEVTSDALSKSIRYALERHHSECVERERRTLQATLHGMDEVLAIVAHDLRTPLASLRMTAEVLLTEAIENTEVAAGFLRSIHDEVLRMNGMVSDILEAARLESGAARWNWSLVRIRKVGQDAIEVVRPLIDGKPINMALEVDPPDLNLNGDADALRRLIVNLLSNAIKHTSEGSIRVCVEESAVESGRSVAISVADTGEGMTEDVCRRLGVAFALNSGPIGSATVKGAGFGLAICKGIVAAHGGSISVASSPKQGTTFTVQLAADLSTPAGTNDLDIVAMAKAA